MPTTNGRAAPGAKKKKLRQAIEILELLGFGPKQSNEVAAYTFLALLDLAPDGPWSSASNPLRGITPIIEFIEAVYRVRYAPNTRETIRDEAVKYFVEAGMVLRNPDNPSRPTNSGNTVYQIEPTALALLRTYETSVWLLQLKEYLASRAAIRTELERERELARIPVRLPSGERVALSPGGQNPLIKQVIEEFCPRFAPGATVVYIGDAENKFLHLEATYLHGLGVVIAPAAKMPDIVVHDTKRNWLLLIEAVTSAGPVDGKRRKELKELFSGCKAGLVFVTAFETRHSAVPPGLDLFGLVPGVETPGYSQMSRRDKVEVSSTLERGRPRNRTFAKQDSHAAAALVDDPRASSGCKPAVAIGARVRPGCPPGRAFHSRAGFSAP